MWAILIGRLAFSPPVDPYQTVLRLTAEMHYLRIYNIVEYGKRKIETIYLQLDLNYLPPTSDLQEVSGRIAGRCGQLLLVSS